MLNKTLSTVLNPKNPKKSGKNKAHSDTWTPKSNFSETRDCDRCENLTWDLAGAFLFRLLFIFLESFLYLELATSN